MFAPSSPAFVTTKTQTTKAMAMRRSWGRSVQDTLALLKVALESFKQLTIESCSTLISLSPAEMCAWQAKEQQWPSFWCRFHAMPQIDEMTKRTDDPVWISPSILNNKSEIKCSPVITFNESHVLEFKALASVPCRARIYSFSSPFQQGGFWPIELFPFNLSVIVACICYYERLLCP